MARTPQVVQNIKATRALREDSPGVASVGSDAGVALDIVGVGGNLAVRNWKEASTGNSNNDSLRHFEARYDGRSRAE